MDTRNFIAKNVATLIQNNEIVNLGIGIPTLVVNHLPADVQMIIHAECGTVGCGKILDNQGGRYNGYNIVDATGTAVELIEGGCVVDSAMSFGIIRGGHLTCSVLGAMQVDEQGNLANWNAPNQRITGAGGAMDLAVGSRKLIIATKHTSKNNEPKIVKKLTMPLTAAGVVDYVVTELAIISIKNGRVYLEALAPGITVEEVQAKTGAELVIPDLNLIKNMTE
jgi:acetate CoA/acetoacetate CoA-transferase beta subunit